MQNDKGIEEEAIIQALDAVVVPKERLSFAMIHGMKQAKRKKRLRVTLQIASAVCVMVIVFLSSIRLSPAFASTVSQIPWLTQLVESIQQGQDKGMLDIVDQQYYEALHIKQTKEEIDFTLDGVIADETGLIVFYTVEAPYELSQLQPKRVKMLLNGKELGAGIGYGWSVGNRKQISEQISIDTETPISYENAQLELHVEFESDIRAKRETIDSVSFNIPFSLDQSIAKTKTYSLEQEVVIDGQRLIVDEVRISPLRAQVDISVDESNTMQVMNVNDIELIDENDEVWGKIINGMTGRGSIREGKVTYFIESNYFRQPQALTLRLGNIEALLKGHDYIEVDFDQQQIIYQPTNINIDFSITNAAISFSIPKEWNNNVLSWGIDAEGKDVYARSGTMKSVEDEDRIVTQSYDLAHAVNPVKFAISSYPAYLTGSAEIEISLE